MCTILWITMNGFVFRCNSLKFIQRAYLNSRALWRRNSSQKRLRVGNQKANKSPPLRKSFRRQMLAVRLPKHLTSYVRDEVFSLFRAGIATYSHYPSELGANKPSAYRRWRTTQTNGLLAKFTTCPARRQSILCDVATFGVLDQTDPRSHVVHSLGDHNAR